MKLNFWSMLLTFFQQSLVNVASSIKKQASKFSDFLESDWLKAEQEDEQLLTPACTGRYGRPPWTPGEDWCDRDFDKIAITVEVAPPLKRLDMANLVNLAFWSWWHRQHDGDYVNIGTMIFTMKSESDPAKHRRWSENTKLLIFIFAGATYLNWRWKDGRWLL